MGRDTLDPKQYPPPTVEEVCALFALAGNPIPEHIKKKLEEYKKELDKLT